jgi:CRP/FNR family transcriptional regulator, cyclic AMP receptor protein
MAFLIQVNEGVKSVVLPLGKAVILIGRDGNSNLYLEDTGISRDHASIVFSNGTYTLKDNGSTSGSIVNGVRVSKHDLRHDDVIQFGPYLFKVDLDNPVPVTTSAVENDVELERAGNSYTRQVELDEIKGGASNGPLHVVMSDTSKALPQPLPASGFLETLSLEQRQSLSQRGVYRYAREGEVLIEEGQNSDRLLLLISGTWEARKGKTVLGRISAGEWVGEVNIFDPSGAMCSVIADAPSEYWEITRAAFEKFINESRSTGSAILIALAATLGRRIRQSAGALDKAVNTPPVVLPPKRSRFTPVFAALAILAIIAAAVFFFTGTTEKNRLQTEKQRLIQDQVETEQEATMSISSLRDVLQKTRADLQQARDEGRQLEERLQAALQEVESIKASQAKTQAPSAPPRAPEAPVERDPAPEEMVATTAETLSGFPSKVLITRKTTVPLVVDGKVSGRVLLPEGRELAVVGAEEDNVIVEFGDTRQTIPKSRTNFAEALAAEAAAHSQPASTPPPATPEPKPPVAQAKPKPPKLPPPADGTSEDLTLDKVTSVLDEVKLLPTLEELLRMRGRVDASDFSRYLRSLESRWKRAAKESADLLSLSGGREEYRDILKKVIEASEMLEPARANLLEAKLREIDASWLKLKTEEKIQNLTDR